MDRNSAHSQRTATRLRSPRARPPRGLLFGNFHNVSITGTIFNDLTGIGSFLPGDPGLQGWTVKLISSAGKTVATTTTDASGDYTFTKVGPGTFTVAETLKNGWIQTDPTSPNTYSVTTTSGSNQSGLLFGNFQLVTFAGEVFNDLNGSGHLDSGEPGLQGWTVNLINALTGATVATTTSNASGGYTFANLYPGEYTIEEVIKSGWYQTQPVNPPGTYTYQAISSSNKVHLNFGNFKLVTVSGEVYNDLNGNGKLNTGRAGPPGLDGGLARIRPATPWQRPQATPRAITSSAACSPGHSRSKKSCNRAGRKPSP